MHGAGGDGAEEREAGEILTGNSNKLFLGSNSVPPAY